MDEIGQKAKRGQVRASDVAKLAGVSSATVSYVLNGVTDQVIRPETRRRVMEAAESLGYVPSAAARALRRGRSNTVMLIQTGLRIGHSFADLIENLTIELSKRGLSLVVTRHINGRPLGPTWRELMPLAVITSRQLEPAESAELVAAGVLQISMNDTVAPTIHIGIDQVGIGQMQVRHLIEKGHRHIAYAAPDNLRVHYIFEQRLAGARAELELAGLSPPVVDVVPYDNDQAAEVLAHWRRDNPQVTAICAYNDECAFAVLSGMAANGLYAPKDLAVIGVDNVNFARFAHPPLTTIDNRMDTLAQQIAARCEAAIPDDADLPAHAPSLIIRAST